MTSFRPRVALLVTASALALTATGTLAASAHAAAPARVALPSSLAVTRGYDDVTGLGAATSALVTAFRK